TVGSFAFLAKDFRTANGTTRRHDELLLMTGTIFGEDFDHVRDHVASALDNHFIADANIFAGDLVHVMERSAFHHHTTYRHGFETRYRRQCAGPADVRLNVENAGGCLARLELIGNGPARRSGDLPQALLQRGAIHFYHQTVDLIGQLVTARFHFVAVLKNFLDAATEPAEGDGFQAPSFKPLAKIPMGSEAYAFNDTGPMKKDIQRPFGRDRGIELFKRSRRRVSRIGKNGLALFLTLAVHFLKRFEREKHLAPDFQSLRNSSAICAQR